MKIKLLVPRVGAGFSQNRGDVIEVSDAEAKRMFEANPPQAVPVRDTPAVEKAAKSRKG